LTEAHLNIENMVNKGKKDVAYTLLDVTGNVTDDLAVKLGAIEPAIRVRVL
jgi:D-3-phosphoglycerate dehydrogenase